MKKQLIAMLLACGMHLQAQEKDGNLFIPPFDFPIYLSGNFGELRSNHFHGGIDFKTEGVEGKPVACIADGYISRITVSPGGYGNALYITHANGYTSVHGHLKSFIRPIAEWVEKYQYENETFAVDIMPDSLLFSFKQGQQVAWSGNTGFSFGPHLHMEIRETKTNEPIDPLQFYLKKVKDTTPPRAQAVMLYPQKGKGIIKGEQSKKSFPIVAPKASNCLSKPIEGWGEVGVGIKAYDYMDGTNNNYGVQSVTLLVDSVEVFNSTISRYSFDENRMLNSWTDFDEFKRHNSWVMKSFIDPGNRLRALRADARRGVITIDEERDYHFLYLLKDLHGNSSQYRFIIRGRKQAIVLDRLRVKHELKWNQTNTVQEPGMQLVIPKGMLYEDVALNSQVQADSASVSFDYQLHDSPVPLHDNCELLIGIRKKPTLDTAKYYVARKLGKAKYYVGGVYQNGWMKVSIRELGTYAVAIDTVPPQVLPIARTTWGRTGKIVYKLADSDSGIKTYKGYIDGQFALFAFDAKSSRLTCTLNPQHVKKGGRHTLELWITDHCGNTTHLKDYFVW